MKQAVALVFHLPIAPAGKERPRVTRFGTFMPKGYEAWREVVRLQVRSKVPAAMLDRLPLTGRLAFRATFHAVHGRMKPDLDNAIGAIWDAIQVPPVKRGGGWGLIANDSQFKRVTAEVVTGVPGITFTVEEII